MTLTEAAPLIRRLGKHWSTHRWQEGMVYFVAAGTGKRFRIKIGWTSRSPRTRLSQLQVGNPERLELLGCIPGPQSMEAQLHSDFVSCAVGGEWFRPNDALLELIEWWAREPPKLELRGEPGEFDSPPAECAQCQEWLAIRGDPDSL